MQDSDLGSPAAQMAVGDSVFTVERAIADLLHGDNSSQYYAAWWLGKFRVNDPSVVDSLIEALRDESDRTEAGGYPLRRNAARALGKLGDSRAVEPLIECLECPDYYVREAATQALEMLGDGRAIPALITLLAGGVEAAVMVAGKPHLVQPYDAVIEALGTLGATEAIAQIQPFLDHPMKRVEYSATRAMYQLTNNSMYGDRLVAGLQGQDLQLRRSVLMDLGAIGYLPSVPVIAKTFAENSLKLIALKGILEHHLDQSENGLILSSDCMEVMQVMDGLL
jgi:phycocyanobilin lyase alpha subunit